MIGLMIRVGYVAATVLASSNVLGTDELWVYCFAIEAGVSIVSTAAAVVCSVSSPIVSRINMYILVIYLYGANS